MDRYNATLCIEALKCLKEKLFENEYSLSIYSEDKEIKSDRKKYILKKTREIDDLILELRKI